jgi:hypothetical protein
LVISSCAKPNFFDFFGGNDQPTPEPPRPDCELPLPDPSTNATTTTEVKVVKDCTGTYIRYHEKDYQVCNFEKLQDIEDGKLITVELYRMEACDNPAFNDLIVCMMVHENEGWVNIVSIK